MCLVKCLLGLRMQFQSTSENSLQMANGYAVIGHWDALSGSCLQAGEHMTAGYDAAAALQNELVGRQIAREVFPYNDINV